MPARTPAGLAGQDDSRTLAAVHDDALTRRRALGLAAVAGLGALLSRPLPALARTAGEPLGFGLSVTAADFPDGGTVSRVLRPGRRFDLLGLRGARGDVEVRVRPRDGSWSRWVSLAVRGDHAPDSGGGERASDPVWTGGSDELQLRSARGARGGLHLHLVSVPASSRRRHRPQPVARAAQAQYPAPPPMVTRAAWGADRVPPREPASYGVVQMAFVHHTVNANNYSPSDSAGIVLAIAKYHRDSNKWNDIGYNFLVDQYGQIFEGRGGGIDQPVIGAHAQGWNSNSTGIAIIGTFETVRPPAAALEAVAKIIGWKLSMHGVPTEGTVAIESPGGADNKYPAGRVITFQRVSGHRDGCNTQCPGTAAYALLPSIRTRSRKYVFELPSGAIQQVSLAVESPQVLYNRQARLSGTVVRGDGAVAAGQAVIVQRRSGSAWLTLGQTTADGTGAWALSIAWQKTAEIRAQADGTSSPSTVVSCLPTLTVKPTTRRVAAGRSVRVRGTVLPAVPVYVLVERKASNGRWRRVTSVRAKVRGTAYDTSVRLATAGTYRLTVKAGSPGANAVAKPRTVKVVGRAKARKAVKSGGHPSGGVRSPS
jgi:hypothetical protein